MVTVAVLYGGWLAAGDGKVTSQVVRCLLVGSQNDERCRRTKYDLVCMRFISEGGKAMKQPHA